MKPQQAIEITAQVFNLPVEEALSKRQFRELCDFRKLAMLIMFLKCEYVARYYHEHHGYRLSTTLIGAPFRKDHASVIHQIKAGLDLLETDEDFKRKFELISMFE